MRYDVDEQHGVVVVRLSGSFGGGPDASKWYDLLHRQVRRGHLRVVVDCGALTSVDPAGLGALAGGLATMRNAGGDLAVTPLDPVGLLVVAVYLNPSPYTLIPLHPYTLTPLHPSAPRPPVLTSALRRFQRHAKA